MADLTLTSRLARSIKRTAGKIAGVNVMSFGYDPDKQARSSLNDSPERRAYQQITQQMESLFSWQNDVSRVIKNRDYRVMIQDIPELARAVEIQNTFAFTGESQSGQVDTNPLRTRFAKGARPEVIEVMTQLDELLRPNALLRPLSIAADTYGDNFVNLVYERDATARLPNGQAGFKVAYVNELGEDDVRIVPAPGGRTAHYMVSPPGQQVYAGGTSFSKMEIVHWARNRKANHRYGTSLLESARRVWSRDEAAQDVTTLLTVLRGVARKSVAYPVSGMVSADDIDTWREKLQQGNFYEDLIDADGTVARRLLSRTQMDDLIYPYQGDRPPTFHDEPAADLRILIALLQHYQEKYFVATGTPAGLACLERSVNASSTLEQQGLYFVKMIHEKQMAINQLWVQIGDRALIARGIQPRVDEYFLNLPHVRRFDAEIQARAERLRAETAKFQMELGMDQKYVINNTIGVPAEQLDTVVVAPPSFINEDGTSKATSHTTEPWTDRSNKP